MLHDYIVVVVKAKEITTGAVRAEEGEKFERDFQSLLMQPFIQHELTPPYTPQ